MSIRCQIKHNGCYPIKSSNEVVKKIKAQIGTKSILVVIYETAHIINIFVGGREKWCINCELIQRDGKIQPMGYLIKIRYDMLCSLDHNFTRGHDIKQILYFLIDYIYQTYPDVKELQFNDMSIRTCENGKSVNLAVMTYLYSGQTWYEKNFGAYISKQHTYDMKKILQKYNDAKKIKWSEMSGTIRSTMPLEDLYNNSSTWKGFFEPIYNNMEIGDFCVFISDWIDSFIAKYFNAFGGLTFLLQIRKLAITYTLSDYIHQGGRRYTRKLTYKQSQDYR